MTALQGDLPDYSVLTQPNVLFAGLFDQSFNTNTQIISFAQPFRIWGLWVAQVQASNAAYAGGGQSNRARISQIDGTNLLVTHTNISKASDHDNMTHTLKLDGFTPVNIGTGWEVSFVVDAGAANTFMHASCGVFYSIP